MTDIDIDIDPLLAEEVPSDSDNSGSVQSETETIALPPRTRPVLLRLAAACVSAVLASGVLSAYPTLAAVLVRAEVFYDAQACQGAATGQCEAQNQQLQTLYTLAFGIAIASFVLTGQIFDRFGAQNCGVWGGVGSACGFGLCALAVSSPSLHWLLYVGLPLADWSGLLNSLALYGFVWHLERYQGSVIGLSNATFNASALMMLLVSAMSARLTLPFCFLFLGACALVSSAIIRAFVPSLDEHDEQAERVVKTRPRRQPFRPAHAIRDALDVARQHAVANALFLFASGIPYIFSVYFSGSYEQYLATELDAKQATHFSDLFGLLFAIFGSLVGPFVGFVFDKIGIRNFLIAIVVVLLVQTITISFVNSASLIVITIISGSLYTNTWQVLVTKWALLYAPLQLVGAFIGVSLSLQGTAMIITNIALGSLTSVPYLTIYLILGILSISVSAAMALGLSTSWKAPTSPPQCRTSGRPLSFCC